MPTPLVQLFDRAIASNEVLAVVVAAESFRGLVSLRYGAMSSLDVWEIRGGIWAGGSGFCMSLLPTLYLLRLVGFRLMIGSRGAGRMTECDTARC